MTYLKRYQITSLLGLSFSEDDTDASDLIVEEEETKPVTKPKSSRRSL